MKPKIYKVIATYNGTVAYDQNRNIINLNIFPQDNVIRGLKSIGYSEKELKNIIWNFEINSGTIFLEYWNGKLRFKKWELWKLDSKAAYKVVHHESLQISEYKTWTSLGYKNTKIKDEFIVPDADYINILKPFVYSKPKKIYKIIMGTERIIYDEDMNPMDIPFLNSDDIIKLLKSRGYTNEELETVFWELKLEYGVVYLDYFKNYLRIEKWKLDKNYKASCSQIFDITKINDDGIPVTIENIVLNTMDE